MVKRKLLAKLLTLIESYLIWDKKSVGQDKKFKKPEKTIMNHPRINNAERLRRMKNNEKIKIGLIIIHFFILWI